MILKRNIIKNTHRKAIKMEIRKNRRSKDQINDIVQRKRQTEEIRKGRLAWGRRPATYT